ncbi:MAG TPA: TonB family protein [Fibrobacteria bacterium]|nr:TonB family protein [Fibrobacteria bacterium]
MDNPKQRIRTEPEDPSGVAMASGTGHPGTPETVLWGGPPKGSSHGWIPPIVVLAAHVAVLASLARLDTAVAQAGGSTMEFRLEPLPSEVVPDAAPSPIANANAAPGSTTSPRIPRGESLDSPMASSPLPEPPAIAATTPSAPESSIEASGTGETPTLSAAETEMDVPPSQDGTEHGGEGASAGSDYLRNPAPEYPALSRLLGEEGRVELLVMVDTSGAPVSVQILHPSRHPRLDGAALRAVWSWAFHPATRKGRPVVASVVVPIRFSLANP